jgi:peptide subunit release factor 1 (eRF1)
VEELHERGTTKGLALFACRAVGLAEAIRLSVRLPDRAHVGQRPFLLPLELAVSGHTPLGLVLTDRERARLGIYQLGVLEELPGLIDYVPAQTSGGGRAQARLARHSDQAAHHHAKRVAEAAAQAFRGVDGVEIVLAGPEAALTDTFGCLRQELAGRVVARRHLPVPAPANELQAVLAEVEAARATERMAQLIERLRAEAGSPTVASGLDEVLGALREKRVATVLVVESASAPGAACPSCGALSLALDCPMCEAATLPLEDVVGPALEAALRQGARVVQVGADAGLEGVGGVGALLRY